MEGLSTHKHFHTSSRLSCPAVHSWQPREGAWTPGGGGRQQLARLASLEPVAQPRVMPGQIKGQFQGRRRRAQLCGEDTGHRRPHAALEDTDQPGETCTFSPAKLLPEPPPNPEAQTSGVLCTPYLSRQWPGGAVRAAGSARKGAGPRKPWAPSLSLPRAFLGLAVAQPCAYLSGTVAAWALGSHPALASPLLACLPSPRGAAQWVLLALRLAQSQHPLPLRRPTPSFLPVLTLPCVPRLLLAEGW